MSWADNLNILLGTSKMFMDDSRASRDREAQAIANIADIKSRSSMNNANMWFQGLSGMADRMTNAIETGRQRAYDWNKMEAEQAFEKPYKDTTAEMQMAQQALAEKQATPDYIKEVTGIATEAEKTIIKERTEQERNGYKTPAKKIFVPYYGELELQESTNEQTAAENIELIRNAYSMGERNLQLAIGNDADKLNASDNFLKRIEMLKQDIAEKALQTKYFTKDAEGNLAPNYAAVPRYPGEAQAVIEQRWNQAVSEIPELIELARNGLDSAFQVLEQYDAVKLAPYDKATYMKVLLNAPPSTTFDVPTEGVEIPSTIQKASTSASFFDIPILGNIGKLFLSKEKKAAIDEIKSNVKAMEAQGVDKNELDFLQALTYTKGLMEDWKTNLNQTPSDNYIKRINDINSMMQQLKSRDTTSAERAGWLETLKKYIALYKDEAYANDPLYKANY